MTAVVPQPSSLDIEAAQEKEKRRRLENFINEIHKSYPSVPQLTVADYLEMKELKKASVLTVDARLEEERNFSFIPNSVSVEMFDSELKAGHVNGYTDIVFYDTVGYRACQYALILVTQQLHKQNRDKERENNDSLKQVQVDEKDERIVTANIHNLQGGILAYAHSKGRLLDSLGQPAGALHIYVKKFDCGPSTYETVWFSEPNCSCCPSCCQNCACSCAIA
eukprot:TRINITY_DN150_c0_g2_i1.p1 TRINITY_DN150_c0_g2~~TRINITY_DN150_c0_g2_i1.p1  ORF type:complete len:222 (-),score=33.61 TRINITY_DN150_c0_g2_i1:312-977(-)